MNNLIKDLTIQDALAVIVSVGVFGLIIARIPVPDQIWSSWTAIIIFFFVQPKNGSIPTPTQPTIVSPGSTVASQEGQKP